MSHDSSNEDISRNQMSLKRTNSSSSRQISNKKAATFKTNNSISDLYLKRPGSTRRDETFGSPGSNNGQNNNYRGPPLKRTMSTTNKSSNQAL